MYFKTVKFLKKSGGCISSRYCLLVWAYLRLVISLLWTGVVLNATMQNIKHSDNFEIRSDYIEIVVFAPIWCLAQFVELGMLVTFIVAGHQKSVELYRAYYIYCITTFIVYLMSVFFAEYSMLMRIYLTFNFVDLFEYSHGKVLIGIAVIGDIILELILILLVKKQITNLTNEAKCRSENFDTKKGEKSVVSV